MNTQKTTEEKIIDLENRVSKLEAILSTSRVKEVDNIKHKKLSAKEFLMTKKIKSEPQKLLAFGYFLEHEEEMASFNVVDLDSVFRLAKEKLPININDVVNKNISKGFLMEDKEKKDSKKAWVLTSSGENYVENELNK